MSDKSVSVSSGISLPVLLTVLFVALKLLAKQVPTPVAEWSWWWVFSPLWISAGIALTVLVVFLAIAFIIALAED
jgi:hypothetical protein